MTPIRDRITAGEFKNALPYPSRPMMPALLSKRGGDLSAAEMARLPTAKAEYEAAKAAYDEAKAAYNAEDARLHTAFREALEAEYGMAGHPKADKLYSKAWEKGHSSGFGEVANEYDDLVELVR